MPIELRKKMKNRQAPCPAAELSAVMERQRETGQFFNR
jgi:hypothetical protein